MNFNFFPKAFNFFDLLEKQVGYAVEASDYFKELTATGVIDEISVAKMQAIEHKADEAAHIIIEQLNKTFITPFDREDIHALAKEVDDIVDMITTIASRMKVYNLTGKDKNLAEFASVINESVKIVASAIKWLKDTKNSKLILDSCVEINSLENLGDSMRDKVLAELFEKEKNPISVIKWKEIYQDAETVLDICEDVAHVICSIIVKQA